ncbi:FAD-dependent oxidoreductase [Actinoplanes sp. NPDC051861]|uniref:NAD(P)/FAD-dependent oxidoreductase n=1 Tax=Actinoplanes sp. NPDC051861 TaxID=3155170 RepID=UPI003449A352
MHEIVILGAGYAGMATAVSLAGRTRRRGDVRITVVNASERFTERLRLHQTATGQELADLRIPDLLSGTGVELVTGWVTAIDTGAKRVRVDDEREIGYDTLVLALGSATDTGAVAGADEFAYTLDSRTTAEALARRLAAPGTKAVAICGLGLTGVEAAAEIAERHPGLDVTLIGGGAPGAGLGPRARRHLDRVLDRRGVRVRGGVRILKVLPDSVEISGGETVPADVVVWAGGVKAPALATAAGLATDRHGRILTDGTLRSVSDPAVYAVGDAAAIEQGYGTIHGTCQSGIPTGVQAAWAISRELDGRAPRPFRFGYLHTPVSLGRRDAVVQFTRPDGSATRFALTGRAAVWYKETVSASPWPTYRRLVRNPGPGRLGWRRGGTFTR